MPTDPAFQYVLTQLGFGVAREQVRATALSGGFTQSEVDAAFAAFDALGNAGSSIQRQAADQQTARPIEIQAEPQTSEAQAKPPEVRAQPQIQEIANVQAQSEAPQPAPAIPAPVLAPRPLIDASIAPVQKPASFGPAAQKYGDRAAVFENTSGQGFRAVAPPEIRGWNWGAFGFSFLWALVNGCYVAAVFCLIPGITFFMPFVLGAQGNVWAWRAKHYDTIEAFRREQGSWSSAFWNIVLLAAILGPIVAFIHFEGFVTPAPANAADAAQKSLIAFRAALGAAREFIQGPAINGFVKRL